MTDDRPRIGIVGAGVAGVGAADALRGAPVDVTVLEKSRGVGGRAATRRKNGCRYDHGANYVRPKDGRTEALLDELGRDGLVDIDRPVWPFDSSGRVRESERPEAHKWTYESGITRLAKRLHDRGDAALHTETRVEEIEWTGGEPTGARAGRDGGEWHIRDADAGAWGPFDAVLLTPPAPQTAGLLDATDWDDPRRERVRDAAASVPYRTIRTLVLHYPERIERPYYALVNTDDEHPVGWVSREECKPGHVPAGESLLIAQMSPDWSAANHDDPLDAAAAAAADHVADLLGENRLRDPDWVDDQGWRYALPDAAAGDDARAAEAAGLYAAGDWVVGDGRVHAALWNGVETGERIAERFA